MRVRDFGVAIAEKIDEKYGERISAGINRSDAAMLDLQHKAAVKITQLKQKASVKLQRAIDGYNERQALKEDDEGILGQSRDQNKINIYKQKILSEADEVRRKKKEKEAEVKGSKSKGVKKLRGVALGGVALRGLLSNITEKAAKVKPDSDEGGDEKTSEGGEYSQDNDAEIVLGKEVTGGAPISGEGVNDNEYYEGQTQIDGQYEGVDYYTENGNTYDANQEYAQYGEGYDQHGNYVYTTQDALDPYSFNEQAQVAQYGSEYGDGAEGEYGYYDESGKYVYYSEHPSPAKEQDNVERFVDQKQDETKPSVVEEDIEVGNIMQPPDKSSESEEGVERKEGKDVEVKEEEVYIDNNEKNTNMSERGDEDEEESQVEEEEYGGNVSSMPSHVRVKLCVGAADGIENLEKQVQRLLDAVKGTLLSPQCLTRDSYVFVFKLFKASKRYSKSFPPYSEWRLGQMQFQVNTF